MVVQNKDGLIIITMTKEEYKKKQREYADLKESDNKLSYLEAYGVDNWEVEYYEDEED